MPGIQFPSREVIEALERQYKGKRIRCLEMPEDPRPVPPGTMGTCEMVDGAGQLIMSWDNGQNLSLIVGTDKFRIVE